MDTSEYLKSLEENLEVLTRMRNKLIEMDKNDVPADFDVVTAVFNEWRSTVSEVSALKEFIEMQEHFKGMKPNGGLSIPGMNMPSNGDDIRKMLGL